MSLLSSISRRIFMLAIIAISVFAFAYQTPFTSADNSPEEVVSITDLLDDESLKIYLELPVNVQEGLNNDALPQVI
jgi:hypothetical protein